MSDRKIPKGKFCNGCFSLWMIMLAMVGIAKTYFFIARRVALCWIQIITAL